MAIFRQGYHVEDRIYSILQQDGFSVERNDVLDHKHKIDFVITKLAGGIFSAPLGVQVTQRVNDKAKLQEFRSAPAPVGVTRRLYLELEGEVDVDMGGNTPLISVILEFQLNRRWVDISDARATISSDFTYVIEDLDEAVRPAPLIVTPETARTESETASTKEVVAAEPAGSPSRVDAGGAAEMLQQKWKGETGVAKRPGTMPEPPELEGLMTAFDRTRHYGFLQSMNGDTYFFHYNQVVDPELQEILQNLSYMSHRDLAYPVKFVDGGVKPGETRHQAVRVRTRQ